MLLSNVATYTGLFFMPTNVLDRRHSPLKQLLRAHGRFEHGGVNDKQQGS